MLPDSAAKPGRARRVKSSFAGMLPPPRAPSERGQPLGPDFKRKKRRRPKFFKNRHLQTPLTTIPSADPNLRLRSFTRNASCFLTRPFVQSAIDRKKPAGSIPVRASSGPCFLGQTSLKPSAPVWTSAFGRTRAAPIPPAAGPENFQCRAAFIQFQRALVSGGQRRCLPSPTRF
jgi:hypothetical protein